MTFHCRCNTENSFSRNFACKLFMMRVGGTLLILDHVVKVKFVAMSNKMCGCGTYYFFCQITSKLHTKFMMAGRTLLILGQEVKCQGHLLQSVKSLGWDTDYRFCWFKLHMSVGHDERRNHIDFVSQRHRLISQFPVFFSPNNMLILTNTLQSVCLCYIIVSSGISKKATPCVHIIMQYQQKIKKRCVTIVIFYLKKLLNIGTDIQYKPYSWKILQLVTELF